MPSEAASYAEVLAVLDAPGTVDREPVRRWIAGRDLLTWSAVFTLVETFPSRIAPELPADEAADFMLRYLVRCVEENPLPGEHLHAGWEAAWLLASLMKGWRLREHRLAGILEAAAADLEHLYRRGDDAAKNRVLCGVLEHAFEDPAIRPLFVHWDRDCDLRDAYRLALEWGRWREGGGK